MPLEPGTRLGHYAVTAFLGEGGMGQVWQATDTQLNRQVALKILPDAFAADPDRLARFKREAQILASLNHPNIAAIYGIEEAEGTRALVLELVEGPTLADRIAHGAMPIEDALPIAKQIAEALEAAHEAGVIHRDLKPANIKVREDGTVKVLDFGLAKALDPEPGSGAAANSPTISLTAAATQMGMVIGTAAYMSPEQAKGKVADKRADIWAFGVVLLEMLTGHRVLSGETVSETLAAVMMKEPEWDRLPADLPSKLADLLRRCVQKDPRQRVRDIGDVRLAMEDGFETAVSAPSDPTVAPKLQVWQRPAAAIAVPLLLVAITGLAVWGLTRSAPRPVARALLTPPPSEPLNLSLPDVNIALTPDGSRLVYRASLGGQPHLFVRPMDELQATPLRGLTNPRNPFISPDGNWVGFFVGGATVLRKVSILGGPAVDISEIPGTRGPRGASWGEDDTIIFATADSSSGLWRVPAGGGEPEQLTTPNTEQGELDHLFPDILPGAEAVLFTITALGSIENAQIAVLTLQTGDIDVLIPGGSNPRYVPTGHIVYGVQGTLRAVTFDLDQLRVTGDPVPVVDGVNTSATGAANYAVVQDGSLVYVSGSGGGVAGGVRLLVWVDREGEEEPLAAEPDLYFGGPRLSPDGTRVALGRADGEGGTDIHIYDVRRNNFTQLTFSAEGELAPLWTPDGEHVVFSSTRDGGAMNLYVKAADGTGEVERLTEGSVRELAYSWSADGETLVFLSGTDLHTLSFESEPSASPLLEAAFNLNRPRVSPDGRWIAYESDEDGAFNVYVQPFPDVDSGKWKVSTQGRGNPVWSPDGTELFYASGDAVMVVPVTTDPSFDVGNPTTLFDGQYGRAFGRSFADFDLSPDGDRLLLRKPAGLDTDATAAPAELVVIFNWFEELKRLVPVS